MQTDLTQMSDEALLDRQRLLEQEMDANDEENRANQAELDCIYEERAKRRASNATPATQPRVL